MSLGLYVTKSVQVAIVGSEQKHIYVTGFLYTYKFIFVCVYVCVCCIDFRKVKSNLNMGWKALKKYLL